MLPASAQTAAVQDRGQKTEATKNTDLLLKLESIRSALVDRALDNKARVRSALWLDEKGELHESTHVSSDLKVRAIRVKPNAHNNPADAVVVELLPGGGDPARCTASAQELRLPLLVAISHEHERDLIDNQLMLGEVGRTIESLVMNQSAQSPGWVPKAFSGANNYQQWVSAGSLQSAPYVLQMKLSLRPSTGPKDIPAWVLDTGVGAFFPRPPAEIELGAQLIESASGHVVWQEAAMLPAMNLTPRTRRPSLPAEWTKKSAEQIASLLERSYSAIKCRRNLFEVSKVTADYFVLNGGGKAGFRPGNQLLVVNGRLIPGKLLEKGAIDETFIAVVKEVYPDYSTVELIGTASPAGSQNNWLAYPL